MTTKQRLRPPTDAEFERAVDDADRRDCGHLVRETAKWIKVETWPKRMAATRRDLLDRITALEAMFRDGTRASTLTAYTFALAEMVKRASEALQPSNKGREGAAKRYAKTKSERAARRAAMIATVDELRGQGVGLDAAREMAAEKHGKSGRQMRRIYPPKS
jgi:hypothetical protein